MKKWLKWVVLIGAALVAAVFIFGLIKGFTGALSQPVADTADALAVAICCVNSRKKFNLMTQPKKSVHLTDGQIWVYPHWIADRM